MPEIETPEIETIVRGVLIKDDMILLCQAKDPGHYFLPGGHVEFYETAEAALLRELSEETGRSDYSVGEFMGAFQNRFKHKDNDHHEICLLFELSTANPDTPISQESHIRFEMVGLDQLADINLLPEFLKPALHGDRLDRKSTWLG